MKTIYYTATTLDGFLADPNHSLDWLFQFDFPDEYAEFIAGIGAVAMVSSTHVLALCERQGLRTRPMKTSYYVGRERLLPTGPSRMARWRKKLFVFMSRNAQSAAQFFGLPPNRVVELGAQVEL